MHLLSSGLALSAQRQVSPFPDEHTMGDFINTMLWSSSHEPQFSHRYSVDFFFNEDNNVSPTGDFVRIEITYI